MAGYCWSTVLLKLQRCRGGGSSDSSLLFTITITSQVLLSLRTGLRAMSLDLQLTQRIDCADVIAIAEEAAAAILKVYSSHVSDQNWAGRAVGQTVG